MFAAAGTLEVALLSFDTADATGCGDTFMGAMLAGRASGYTLCSSVGLVRLRLRGLRPRRSGVVRFRAPD